MLPAAIGMICKSNLKSVGHSCLQTLYVCLQEPDDPLHKARLDLEGRAHFFVLLFINCIPGEPHQMTQ